MIPTTLDHAPVIVAVDDSDDSREAAAWAAEHAAAWGAPLHMITDAPGGATTPPAWLGVSRVAAWRAGQDPDSTECVPGDLLRAIADRAADAQMIVLPGTVAGTLSTALAERVGCPVVVCHDGHPPTVVLTSQARHDRSAGGATAIGAGSHS